MSTARGEFIVVLPLRRAPQTYARREKAGGSCGGFSRFHRVHVGEARGFKSPPSARASSPFFWCLGCSSMLASPPCFYGGNHYSLPAVLVYRLIGQLYQYALRTPTSKVTCLRLPCAASPLILWKLLSGPCERCNNYTCPRQACDTISVQNVWTDTVQALARAAL